MPIPRPKRSSRRYAGDGAVGTEGVANLSSMKKGGRSRKGRADGKTLRLRYAVGVAAGLAIVVGALVLGLNKNNKNNNNNYSEDDDAYLAMGAGGGSNKGSGNGNGNGKGGDATTANTEMTTADFVQVPLTPENSLKAYEEITTQSLQDLSASAAVYRHNKSGMEVVTMIPADPFQDATFGIGFRTPPLRNDGAQHVVKNAVLAGSKKYPVKDPFNQLKRGSLQTYSDAWTERDRTSFVVASHNPADFRNNLQVTLDAVFHPLFIDPTHKWIYRQEGWRLESPDNKNLVINGNAYVDAKAAQMNPEEVMIKQIYSNLFPDHVYGNNPKGEASEVVTMTYQELTDYYLNHYHPSNGKAFCYGKQDFLDVCLAELSSVLNDFEDDNTVRLKTTVAWQPLTELDSETKNIHYPDVQETVDYRSAIGWVLNESPMTMRTKVAWHLIYELLAGSSTALIPRVVISELNLGSDVITHFQNSLQQWVMALGVSGIDRAEDVAIANAAIVKELEKVAANGFDKDAVLAALHKMTFQFREQSSSSSSGSKKDKDNMPRGARYFRDVMSEWNYDREAMTPLQASSALVELTTELNEVGQGVLMDLITRYMLDSKHTTALSLQPDMDYALQYEKLEQQWLDNLDAYLDKETGIRVMKETAILKEVQKKGDSEKALKTIPRLNHKDLNKNVYRPPSKVMEDLFESGITALSHELPFTNGIAYVDFSLDLSNLDFDDVVLIPLFCQLLLEGGTAIHNDVKMQQQIDKYTGGVTITPVIEEIVETDSEGYYVVPNGKNLVTKVILSGSCIASETCLPMLNLFRQFVWDSDVRNKQKAIDILEARINEMEEDIQINGHKYTTSRIESRYSLSGFVREQWYGVTQLMQMRRALAQIKENFNDLSLRLVKMQDSVKRAHRSGIHFSITGDEDALTDLKGPMENFLMSGLPLPTQKTPFQNFTSTEHPWVPKGMHRVKEELMSETSNQAFTVPTRVNHVAKGGILYDVGERIPGADMVVTQYLGGYYLYNELRFGQGAQEAWSFLDLDSGVCIYQSDRDPSIFKTLETYEKGASWLYDQVHQEESLPVEAFAAVVGAIGRLDAHVKTEPNKLGKASLISYLKNDRIHYKQNWRNQILNANLNDFIAMVERLGAWGHPSVCIVTSPEIFETIDQEDFTISKCDISGYRC